MISFKEEKNALILLFVVIILLSGCALFMETIGIDMFAPCYSEDANVGTLVKHSGIADKVRTTQTGGHMTASVNGVKVFIPDNVFCPDFADGDYICVRGIVDEYMDEVEIRVIKVELMNKNY